MHVFIEGMMIQDVPRGRYWKPKPAPQQRGPQQAGQRRAKKWRPGNSSPERNPSLPEDNQIMHSKIGLHLVKIHVLIIFLMSKVSKVLCVKYSRINCMHVGGVKRSTCTVHILYTALLFQAR